MRITIVGPGKRFISGVSYYTISLANALAEQHQVSVLLLRDLLPRRLFPGGARVGQSISALTFSETISVCNGLDWYWGTSAARAIGFLQAQEPEVLILQWWTSAAAHSYLLLRLANALGSRAQTVIEFHEILDPFEQSILPLRLYVQVARRLLFGKIGAYVAHSRGEQAELARIYRLPTNQGFIVNHGSYGHFRQPGQLQPAPRAPFTFLYLGLIRPYKGVEHLIQAFDMLPAALAQQARLVIVGETWEGHHLPAQLIAASPNRERIEFVNRYVTDGEVDHYFSQADVACYPYRRASQSGAARIAISYGIPIIASRVGGLAESLPEYAGTYWCEPGNVAGLRDSLIAVMSAGRRRDYADPFPWSRTARDYQAVFDHLAIAGQSLVPRPSEKSL